MTTANTAAEHVSDMAEQVADIRERLKTIMDRRVTPAVVEVGGQADGFVRAAAGKMKEQTGVVSGQLRERPITAVLVGACVGFVLGRLLA